MSDEHTSFIKTPKQLAIVVLLSFAVPISLIVLLSQLVTGMMPASSREADTQVLARIQPVGQLAFADATPSGNKTGEQVFQGSARRVTKAGSPERRNSATRLHGRYRSSPVTTC